MSWLYAAFGPAPDWQSAAEKRAQKRLDPCARELLHVASDPGVGALTCQG